MGAGFNNTTGSRNAYIGTDAGDTAPNNIQNLFISGSGASGGVERIDNVYFGKGYAATTPTGYTIDGTGGSGTDIAGANVSLAGGKGTGAGAGGAITFQYAPAGSTGSSLNSLVEAARVSSTGFFAVGTTTPYSKLTVWGTDTASTLTLNMPIDGANWGQPGLLSTKREGRPHVS